MLVDLGETWSSPRYIEIRDSTGALGAAGSVTSTITQTDGTTAPGIIGAGPTAGQYTLDFTPPLVDGRYDVVTTATGGVLGSFVRKFTDTFTVTSAALLVSVDDALEYMRAQQTITSYPDREYLRWLCLLATKAVEGDVRRALVRQTVTEEHPAAGYRIWLNRSPALSVISVSVDGGTDLDPAGYRLMSDGSVKFLQPLCGTTFGVATFIYLAGTADPPMVTVKMARELVSRNWQQTQQKPHVYSDDVSALQQFTPQVALLTDPERRQYEALRFPVIA